MTENSPPQVSRRGLLGGVASLAAAASFSLTMSPSAAARIQDGDDSDRQTVSSPDGSLELTVDVADGPPSYSVTYDGTTVVGDSALGLEFQDQASLGPDLTVTGSERSSTDETWEPVWDQYEEIRDNYEELRIGVVESESPERALTFAVRAYDDGVAFRWLFPEDSGFGEFVITDERTRFAFEDDHTAWWIQNDYNSYEYEYGESPLTQIFEGSPGNGAHTPLTMRTDDGLYLSVHEADLIDYAGMGLVGTESGSTVFESDLAPLPDGTKVKAATPHRTPWRTIQVAERPGALIESNLIVNCNEPRDPEMFPQGVDWIEPQKFMGVWWLMITGRADWQYFGETTGNHGAKTERMQRVMAFASEHGIPSVLVEGWNQGWDSYPGSGNTLDFTETYPDFDIEAVTEFGAQLDPPVAMTSHNETSGNINNYETQLLDEQPHPFEYYDGLGINSIKTGYVADDGVTVDGQNHNHHCQVLVNHHHLVYREAAEHRQMLEVHEPIKPTGERRRYPHVMTREGVFGQEYDSFGEVSTDHHVTFPFTRMLAGPVEYTPGIFDMDSGAGGIETTRAKQLAMYPVYLSGLHMVADLPSSYLADREARFEVGEVFQAEFADSDFGTEAKWARAQGGKYLTVSGGGSDRSATMTVEVPSAGEYDVHVRYAAANGDRALTLVVGDQQQELPLPQTEYWDVWDSVSTTLSFESGENELSLTLGSGVSGFNVDAVAVTESGESMPDPGFDPIRGPTFESFQFIEDVPAAGWDDTRVLDSVIGEYVAVARQHGEEWYLGVMTGDSGRTLDIPLSFLGDGEFVAEIYTDGADARFDTALDPVAVDRAIVDSETTLLASMVKSGGTAVRFYPASDGELAELPAYERPEQEVTATIATDIRIDEQFIQLSGSNTGDFIGGTPVEIVVDSEVVASENVRLPANSTDVTVDFAQTIDSGGTYDVVVRTGDGDQLASEQVSVTEPDIVANLSDPTGDDNGPGSYTYPTGEAFQTGAFDLSSVFVQQTDEEVLVRFEPGNLYDAQGASNGFSPHMFVVWIHDPSADGGRRSSLEDLGANVEFTRPWHYRIAVGGETASAVDASGDSITDELRLTADIEDDTLGVRFDRAAVDGGDFNQFGAVVAVHSEDDGRLRAVEAEATEDAFGGAQEGAVENAPRITDMLTSFENPQSEALSYSTDERATLPYVPLGDSLPEPTPPEDDSDGDDSGGDGATETTTQSESRTTAESDSDTTTESDTESGDGPGFGVVSGLLGTAGGAAYAARSLFEDSEEQDP